MATREEKTRVIKSLEYAIAACLFLFAFAAPHSIAATQTSLLLGLVFWTVRFVFRPRPQLYRTPIDYWMFGFFILTGLSAFLSYEPMVSIGKLRAASLFTIVYLVAQNVRSLRMVHLLAITLISSCMINVVYTASERILGRGVKVFGVAQNSALYIAGVRDGDTLLKVDRELLYDPQQLVDELSKPDAKPLELMIYRHEWQPTFKVARGNLIQSNDALQQLGISNWTRGRDWRASGFFGHYVTYAEVLQLVLALALALFVSLPNKRGRNGLLLIIALVGLLGALFLTVTRAVWLGALLSSVTILLFGLGRRGLVVASVVTIPLVLAGLFFLQAKRNVGFIDQADASTSWRQMVWREGTQLLISKPRHLLVGVGMDSIKSHYLEWGLFDGGKQPRGHMHSNFLQIALERGVPALLVWLGLLFIYGRTLWQSIQKEATSDWMTRGLLIGAFGGLVGFVVSGVVHYNWGDSEVVMVVYFIMGLTLAIHHQFKPSQT